VGGWKIVISYHAPLTTFGEAYKIEEHDLHFLIDQSNFILHHFPITSRAKYTTGQKFLKGTESRISDKNLGWIS
jgi:hypothetical protein